MFQHRATQFDPRVFAIAGHLRPSKKNSAELEEAPAETHPRARLAASNQIAEAIWPILNDIVDRFGRGQHGAVGEAASLGNEAIKFSARAGNDALGRIATQAKTRPLAAFAVAIGVGILIGIAVRRS